jgi:hypothetical protein
MVVGTYRVPRGYLLHQLPTAKRGRGIWACGSLHIAASLDSVGEIQYDLDLVTSKYHSFSNAPVACLAAPAIDV